MKGRNRSLVLSAIALALLLPANAPAATLTGPGDAARARELRARAESLFDQPKEWGKAAKLLEASAVLRQADDAEAYTCLLGAGRIRAAMRDYDDATRLLRQAGDQALARGAVLEAALAYAFGAHTAALDDDRTGATALIAKARLLAGSPLLAEAQRADVLSLIN